MIPKLNSAHGSETRNIINRAIEVLNQQGIYIQDIVAEGQLTEEQYAQLIKVVNGMVKSGEVDENDLTLELRSAIRGKVDFEHFQNQIKNIINGSPKGVFETVSDLQNEYPNGKEGVFVVVENGNWYYWDGNGWVAGGVYQSTLPSEFNAVNLINNGDFSDGLTGGWKTSYADVVVDNGALNTADGRNSFGQLAQDVRGLNIGDKYYLKANITPLNQAVYIGVGLNHAQESASIINNPQVNENFMVSGIFTPTDQTNVFFIRHNYSSAATAAGKQVKINHVLAINLTTLFGKGYEPSAEEIDNLIRSFTNNWFDDSARLTGAEGVYRKLIDTSRLYQPILEIPRNGLMVKGEDDVYHARELLGSFNQIEITNPDGVDYHPKIGIPTDATPLRPALTSVVMGDNTSPDMSDWQGEKAEWNGTEWVIEQTGSIYTSISVESDKEYEIDIQWTDTNSYVGLDFFPKLYVKMGTVTSEPQFTGYSDALYKLTMTAAESGQVEFRLGDENEPWSASIKNVIIRPIEQKVSRAGRIGTGSMDLYTQGSNLAIGRGHAKRVSGNHNYAIGLDSQKNLTVGNGNVSMGAYAQELNETGIFNTAHGYGTLRRLITGAYNTAIGYSALAYTKEGNWNTAIGNEAGRDITFGNRNTALGSRALFSLTEGNDNVGIGRLAGEFPKQRTIRSTVDKRQTIVGTESGKFNDVKADHLTTLGFHSVGTENSTALGAYTEAQGRGSVAIGLDSEGGFATATQDDEFVLGTQNHHVKVPGKFNVAQYTPTSSSDSAGEVGDITTDDDYVYVKTSQGWKRSSLETF